MTDRLAETISGIGIMGNSEAAMPPDWAVMTLPEQIAVKLGRGIVDGNYQLGERLSEQKLAEQFGVSRGPIRDALQQLDVHGFIELRPRLGARVLGVSRYEWQQLFEVKRCLLCLISRYAARNVKPDHLEVLHEGLDLLEQSSKATNIGVAGFFAQTRGLWRVIHLAADARRITLVNDFVMGSTIWQMVYWDRMRVSLVTPSGKQLVEAWRGLVDGIERRDEKLAEQRASALLDRLWSMLDEVFPAE